MTSLRSAIKRLRINPGDVIMVKIRSGLTERVANIGIPDLDGTPILEVDDFDSIRAISEKTMHALGWCRVKEDK